jgi:hypothetical protein
MSNASEMSFDFAANLNVNKWPDRIRRISPCVLQRHPFECETTIVQSRRLNVTMTEILHIGAASTVYLGNAVIDMKNTALVLKVNEPYLMEDLLLESRRYAELKELQNDIIPLCYGLYENCAESDGHPNLAILVLEYCGETFPDLFRNLPLTDRYIILLITPNCPN